MSAAEHYVLGDWGTSRLRLYLMERERVLQLVEGPGIGSSQGQCAEILDSLVAPWTTSNESLDITLCGMASSRNGLHEVPYVAAPTTATAWVRAAGTLQIGRNRVWLATGIQCTDLYGGFDVMRGEETQVFGAFGLDAQLSKGSHVCILPGTHSKWVSVEDGAIMRFRTALTGELYAVLKEHSVLFRAGAEEGEGFDDGFTAGHERSARSQESVLTAGFHARTAQLLQGRSRTWASGYISGLLLGTEVRELIGTFDTGGTITLIGENQLVGLYERVLSSRGANFRVLDVTQCTLSGLRILREHLAASSTH